MVVHHLLFQWLYPLWLICLHCQLWGYLPIQIHRIHLQEKLPLCRKEGRIVKVHNTSIIWCMVELEVVNVVIVNRSGFNTAVKEYTYSLVVVVFSLLKSTERVCHSFTLVTSVQISFAGLEPPSNFIKIGTAFSESTWMLN